MIRVTGLPSVDRYPRASVARDEDALHLEFSGEDGTTQVDVPVERFDEEDDLESVELRLLADLQGKGYLVERVT